MICPPLAGDGHDLVQKAVSWALRELAKRDPSGVKKFVADYRDRLQTRVVREVASKLTTGRKN